MADVLTQAQIDEMLKNVAAGAVPWPRKMLRIQYLMRQK